MLIHQQVAATVNAAFAGALGILLLGVPILVVAAYNGVLGRLSPRKNLACGVRP